MIVEEPPYELVGLFACADAMRFVSAAIERGQRASCLRHLRWRALRDPRRDQVAQKPDALLGPFLAQPDLRFLLMWDHEGSGRERERPDEVEADVLARLGRRGVDASRVCAVALVPELEACFAPAWARVADVVAAARRRPRPTDQALLAKLRKFGKEHRDIEDALRVHPKDALGALLALLELRRSPALYEDLGARLPLSQIKLAPPMLRVANALQEWFGFTLADGDPA